jgi:hypothetical protein
MNRIRPLLAFLIALTLAFSPVTAFAMSKSCQEMQQTMTDNGTAGASTADHGNMADCPCHNSMPNCGTMPQCQTASGCANQCSTSCGVLPTVTALVALDHDFFAAAASMLPASLFITPPAPPPRA